MNLSLATSLARVTSAVLSAPTLVLQPLLLFMLAYPDKKGNVYNILWVLVFGFATLNILTLVTRRFETRRRGLSFGELLAVTVVVVSIILLGWEMLNLFHIFPIKLQPR